MTPRAAALPPASLLLLLLSALLLSLSPNYHVSADEWCSPEYPESCDARQADELGIARRACSLYLAPSTINGAGLGLFAGRSVPKDWSVHEYASYCEDEPEDIQDAESTMWTDLFVTVWNRDRKEIKWARDYVWKDPENKSGFDESLDGDVYLCEDGRRGERDTALLSPVAVYAFGIGSLANSHPSLANMRRFTERFQILKQDENHKAVLDPKAGHRTRPGGFVDLQAPFDAGVGAFQPTYGNDYYSTKKIKAGQELLLNYGKKWHANQSKKKENAEGSGESSDDELDAELINAEMSKSDTVRSLDWLEENGMCLFDATLTMSPTTLPEAARGAFVNRKVRRGEVLATSPVMVVRRDDLLVSNSDHSGTYQILLNYAFGHPDSSVLLVPMAPVVEYINHAPPSASIINNGEDPVTNAAVRWPEAGDGSGAARLYGEAESWLGMSVDELLEMSGKIAIEYVATVDINKGSEVYVDYGAGWDKSWSDFVAMHPYERAGYFRREMAVPDGMYPEGWLDLAE